MGSIRPGEPRGAEPFERVCSLCRVQINSYLVFFFETLDLRRAPLL